MPSTAHLSHLSTELAELGPQLDAITVRDDRLNVPGLRKQQRTMQLNQPKGIMAQHRAQTLPLRTVHQRTAGMQRSTHRVGSGVLVPRRLVRQDGARMHHGGHRSVAFLNGNNGSWTNTDDVVARPAGFPKKKWRALTDAEKIAVSKGAVVGRGAYMTARKAGELVAQGAEALIPEAKLGLGALKQMINALPDKEKSSISKMLGKSGVGRFFSGLVSGRGRYLPYLNGDVFSDEAFPSTGTAKANSLMPGGSSPIDPYFETPMAQTQVLHVTYKVATITTPATAGEAGRSIAYFDVNPGLYKTVGRDAAIANQYQSYQMVGGVVVYKSEYNMGTKNSVGNVYIGGAYGANQTVDSIPEFDALRPSRGSTCIQGSQLGFAHYIECDPKLLSGRWAHGFSVRENDVTDKADYDHCRIYYGVEAGTDTLSTYVGDLYFTAAFLLTGKQGDAPCNGFLSCDMNSLTGASPLGTSITTWTSRGVCEGITLDCTNRTITFGPSCRGLVFNVNYTVIGTAATTVAPTFTLSGAAWVAVYRNNGTAWSGGVASNVGASQDRYVNDMFVQINATNATITVGASGTLPSAPTVRQLTITPVYDV